MSEMRGAAKLRFITFQGDFFKLKEGGYWGPRGSVRERRDWRRGMEKRPRKVW
jgi:hypothetical protein